MTPQIDRMFCSDFPISGDWPYVSQRPSARLLAASIDSAHDLDRLGRVSEPVRIRPGTQDGALRVRYVAEPVTAVVVDPGHPIVSSLVDELGAEPTEHHRLTFPLRTRKRAEL